jgi:hypothetical protein
MIRPGDGNEQRRECSNVIQQKEMPENQQQYVGQGEGNT